VDEDQYIEHTDGGGKVRQVSQTEDCAIYLGHVMLSFPSVSVCLYMCRCQANGGSRWQQMRTVLLAAKSPVHCGGCP
jgi:hypothetical protein